MLHAGRWIDGTALVWTALALGVGCGGTLDVGGGGGGAGGGDGTPSAEPSRQGPPAFVVGGFKAEMPEITLGPGEEAYPCMIVPLDLSGPSHVVGGGYVTTGTGMHHGNITGRKSTGEGVRPCPADQGALGGEADDILHGGSVLFGSTTQFVGTEWRTFPDGMGFPIDDDYEIVLRMHYLNPTQDEITIAPKYEWFTIDETKVTHLLGPFLWAYSNFEIAPHSELTVTADCPIDGTMNIVSMMPHMHKLGTRFYAAFYGGPNDGKTFLDTPGYNPDGLIEGFDPALNLDGATGFTFSCTWNNTFDKQIVEGYGDNEMCMLFGYAYPYEDAFSALSTPGGACLTVGLEPRN